MAVFNLFYSSFFSLSMSSTFFSCYWVILLISSSAIVLHLFSISAIYICWSFFVVCRSIFSSSLAICALSCYISEVVSAFSEESSLICCSSWAFLVWVSWVRWHCSVSFFSIFSFCALSWLSLFLSAVTVFLCSLSSLNLSCSESVRSLMSWSFCSLTTANSSVLFLSLV